MSQLKVFEFAKELGLETLALMDKIREWQLPVKSHMASLDEEMMKEIRSRLEGQAQAAQGAKKATKKKVAKKKAAESASKAKKKTVKKAAPDGGVSPAKKTVRKKTKAVIRRKGGALEKNQDAAEAAAQAAAKAAEEAQEAAKAAEEAAALAAEEQGSSEIAEGYTDSPARGGVSSEAESTAVPISSAPGRLESGATGEGAAPVARPRGNIVGRMDLRRVMPVSSPRGGGAPGSAAAGAGAQAGGAGSAGGLAARGSRSAPRNLRTGFFAAPSMDLEPAVDPYAEKKARDDKFGIKKKPGVGGGKEEPVQHFSATEFRKREVIFQPKKKRLQVGREAKKTMITTPKASKRMVKVYGSIKLSELAQQMGLKVPELMKKLMALGVMANMNTDLDFDTVALVVPDFGFEAQNLERSVDEVIEGLAFGDIQAELQPRPPVVTVMGHVDHGKTTLLDSIRRTNVVSGEAGGITQHIGAYSVNLDSGQKVTFIDTPGHEAFTAMRARGAHVTDVVIIVVAADDGVMPQTAEAINHAKAADVPIVVAVNKIDKPGANVDRIKQQLAEYELVPEEWGGTTIFCEVSALKNEGITELLEQVLVVAEILELKANPKRSASGTVIESRMEKGRGCVATLLVREGTLTIGQDLVAGTVAGRVRSMLNDRRETVKSVGPGEPVEIMGLPETPQAGDRFDVVKSEEAAREVAEKRKAAKVAEETPNSKMSLDQIFAKLKSGDVKELAMVLKADVAGSIEAIKGMVEKLATEEVKVKLIHSAVGAVSESDVLLASTAQALVVGFNVRPDGGAQRLAKDKNIEIKCYTIIYELIDDLKKAMSGLLSPDVVEEAQGRAEVRETFVVPKMGTIAGCSVVDGKISRNHLLRLVRDGRVVYEGKVGSLRRFKDDVKEVQSGYECGIGIENFNDIKVGDLIEAYTLEERVRELQ